jgi:hypothetical protein
MLLARNDQKAPADRLLAPRTTVNLDEAHCVAESFDVPRRTPATHASMVPGPTSPILERMRSSQTTGEIG